MSCTVASGMFPLPEAAPRERTDMPPACFPSNAPEGHNLANRVRSARITKSTPPHAPEGQNFIFFKKKAKKICTIKKNALTLQRNSGD